MTGGVDIKLLIEEEDLVVWFHEGTSDRLVLSFCGIDGKNVPVPQPAFARSATENGKHHCLFISDPKRTWLNGSGLINRILVVIEDAKRICCAREIVALGTSMGGYSAIYFAGLIEIKTVLALSPQFSVHPKVVPGDRRWWYHRKFIDTHRVRTAFDYFSETTHYVVIHGSDFSESAQRDRFPVARNISHLILTGFGHLFPERLKERKQLFDTVVAGLNNDMTGLVKALGPIEVQPRKLDIYPMLDAAE